MAVLNLEVKTGTRTFRPRILVISGCKRILKIVFLVILRLQFFPATGWVTASGRVLVPLVGTTIRDIPLKGYSTPSFRPAGLKVPLNLIETKLGGTPGVRKEYLAPKDFVFARGRNVKHKLLFLPVSV